MDFAQLAQSPTTEKSEANKYDCGFIKHDMDFDSQNILDANRSKLINNHYDISLLKEHIVEFKTNIDDSNMEDNNKVKLLEFDCNFESGNIGQVHHYRGNEYDITIRGDTNNERHAIWFYFRVKGGVAGNKLICHVSNYSKGKSLYSEGFTPLIRSKTRPIWTRLPSQNVNWFKCNRHKKNCFTISFVFDRSGDEYFFAYSYVYTYSYLQKFLFDIEHLNLPFFKRELLARTVQQRRVDCLRIQEIDENVSNNIDDRPVVVFSARVHPGETPSSYIMDGLIEFLISSHEAAVFLRRNLTIFIIPMLNPDGVFIGNYRSTSLGYDLNRHWHHPDFVQHPTICSLKLLLRQLDVANKLDFYMDLHAHTNALDGFMYCNPSEPETDASAQIEEENEKHYLRNDFTTIFPRLLDLHCKEYSFTKTKFCNNPKKAGSARRAMEAILSDIPICYTFEVSFFKSNQKNSQITKLPCLYSQETYRNLGRCIVQSFSDLYKVPKNKRHDLNLYNFKSRRFMKGDFRRKLQKTTNKKQKESENNTTNTNKIKISIPTVPTI